jgi:hypothetical protein
MICNMQAGTYCVICKNAVHCNVDISDDQSFDVWEFTPACSTSTVRHSISFREQSGIIQETFRERLGNIMGFWEDWEHSGNIQGTFKELSRNIQGNRWVL